MTYAVVQVLAAALLSVVLIASVAMGYLFIGWLRVQVWRIRADLAIRKRLREMAGE